MLDVMKEFKESLVDGEQEDSSIMLAAFERLDYEQLVLLELAMIYAEEGGWMEGHRQTSAVHAVLNNKKV